MTYLIDSNTFMTAARSFYSFDFGEKFWNFLIQEAENGNLASIDKVLAEINKGKDVLKEWANQKFSNYFLSTDDERVILKYGELMRWAGTQEKNYTSNAVDEFMKEDNADPWLIAFAMIDLKLYTIVTFEKYHPDMKRKIPIPNVCKDFKVSYTDLFEMLRNLGFRL